MNLIRKNVIEHDFWFIPDHVTRKLHSNNHTQDSTQSHDNGIYQMPTYFCLRQHVNGLHICWHCSNLSRSPKKYCRQQLSKTFPYFTGHEDVYVKRANVIAIEQQTSDMKEKLFNGLSDGIFLRIRSNGRIGSLNTEWNTRDDDDDQLRKEHATQLSSQMARGVAMRSEVKKLIVTTGINP